MKNYFNLNYNLKTIQFTDGTRWERNAVENLLKSQRTATSTPSLSQSDQLIQAIAAFAPSSAGQTHLPP